MFHAYPTLAILGLNDHLLIVVVLILLLFGGKKIPELLYGAGRGIGEFKKGLEDARNECAKIEPKPEPKPHELPANTQSIPHVATTLSGTNASTDSKDSNV
jgi:sec-independent protein translocase protein TatA